MDTGVPAQRDLRRQVPETRDRVADRLEAGARDPGRSEQERTADVHVVGRSLAAISCRQSDRRLSAPASSADANGAGSASAAPMAAPARRCSQNRRRDFFIAMFAPERARGHLATETRPLSIRRAVRASAAGERDGPAQHEEYWRLLPVGNTAARTAGW
jgi:hypothetical protein